MMPWTATALAIAVLALAAAALSAGGAQRWRRRSADLLQRLEAVRRAPMLATYDPQRELEGLPEPVQRYFRVVLTDGANTQGVEPATAAESAAVRGLRVFTIGFGTTTPSRMACTGRQAGGWAGGGPRGGFGGGAGRNPRVIDEATLRAVAEITGGQYYKAESADQLQGALGDLPSQVTVVSVGHAYRLGAARLKNEFDHGGPLPHLLLRYTEALIAQTGQIAVCNRRHSVEKQLSRWILTCLDRLPSNELAMTSRQSSTPSSGVTHCWRIIAATTSSTTA